MSNWWDQPGQPLVPASQSGSHAGLVDLASEVTGNLAVSHLNSGTGASASTYWRGDGSWGTPAGSGMSNPMTTAGDLITGGASGTPARLAKGSDGKVLSMVSGSVAWADAPMTNPMTTAGDLILGGASGAAARLAKGVDGKVLSMVSGAVAWADAPGGGLAIGATVSGATAGSLLYVGTGPVLAQENAHFFYDAAATQVFLGATASAMTDHPNFGSDPALILGANGNGARLWLFSSNENPSTINFSTNNNTLASPAGVGSGDSAMDLVSWFYSTDDAQYVVGAELTTKVDGAPGAGFVMPARFVFSTRASDGTFVERAYITSAGTTALTPPQSTTSIAMVGPLEIQSMTAGSVPFFDTGGVLAQDNANFRYAASLNTWYFGNAPAATLPGSVPPTTLVLGNGTANNNYPGWTVIGSDATAYAQLAVHYTGTSLSAPTVPTPNTRIALLDFGANNASLAHAAAFQLDILTDPDLLVTGNGIPGSVRFLVGTVIDPIECYRMTAAITTSVNGAAGASNGSTHIFAGRAEFQQEILSALYTKLDASPGSEQVTNGAFTGNATGWTLGAAWHYNTNAVDKDTDGTTTLAQNVTAKQGDIYHVTYTISALTAGTVTPAVGGVSGTARSADGTYTDCIRSSGTGNLTFTPTDTARFTIDAISVVKIGSWTQPHLADPAADAGALATWAAAINDAMEAYGLLATS